MSALSSTGPPTPNTSMCKKTRKNHSGGRCDRDRRSTPAGVLLWGTGVVFEALADRQPRVFRSDASHQGVVMDRGLWAWTRHPNYFGDACVWWGLWLITITAWWSLTTALSPLLMTYFLVYVTGARLAEKYMVGRPGFSEYQARTSFILFRAPATPTYARIGAK
jgi:steroid 5-alpha reductase family enzyme